MFSSSDLIGNLRNDAFTLSRLRIVPPLLNIHRSAVFGDDLVWPQATPGSVQPQCSCLCVVQNPT
jgi:hypothetical protein